jgi:lipopolysaccharide/colanic/teichoic acid biosynthesis glycosyltransferase
LFASGLLLVLSPVILIICFISAFYGPVFFTQLRLGQYKKAFTIYKFRTLRDLDARIPDNQWYTFLRKSGLDELPQIWNIVRGDMNFIGPRPLLLEYEGRFTYKQDMRHLVKPGITGLAQTKGRNAISWEDQFEYDLCYVNDKSLIMDFQIALGTLRILFSVDPEENKIREKFNPKAVQERHNNADLI